MVYSVEIPIALLLRTHDVLMFFVDEVMKFLPPVGATSHFNTVSILRRTALMRNSSASINGFLTDNEIIWEETILYNCLRDVEYWNMVEDHSWFGYIMNYPLRRHVNMMMNDMKDIPMGTMENNRMDKPAADQTIHSTRGKVTKVDGSSGMVTLAHEPVGTLNWPSMTMGFMVMDKALLEKLSVGKTVDFDFVQSGKGYAITSVR